MLTLIGHGYIGGAIACELHGQRREFNWINHRDELPRNTDVVINAAGYTGVPNVDACEIYKQECVYGNAVWPVELEAKCRGIPVVHISSGCIYTGYKDGGWTEDDEPNFTFNNGSFYSGSKALGQTLLTPYMDKSYLLRIRMPFCASTNSKNFLQKLLNYPKLVSYDNSLSYVDDVAKVAIHFATVFPEAGIYNVCNPGHSNAREIMGLMGVKKDWFTEEEFKAATVAPRSNCVLNVDKLSKVYPLRPVQEVLTDVIGQFHQRYLLYKNNNNI